MEVPEAEISALGALRHDREWALVDAQGNYINAKRHPRLHSVRATFDPACTEVVLSAPEFASAQFSLNDSKRIEAWLSQALEQPVQLMRDSQQGFPDDLEANGPTITTQASLDLIASWFGLNREETSRRFRTNLEIEGAPAFWEDRLFTLEGSVVPFEIGKIAFQGINPCQRCAVPARDTRTGESIPGFQKRFTEERRRSLPAWSDSSRFDHFYRFALNTRVVPGQMGKRLRVGDPVRLPGLKA